MLVIEERPPLAVPPTRAELNVMRCLGAAVGAGLLAYAGFRCGWRRGLIGSGIGGLVLFRTVFGRLPFQAPPARPLSPSGARDVVQEASEESFPASDAPAW